MKRFLLAIVIFMLMAFPSGTVSAAAVGGRNINVQIMFGQNPAGSEVSGMKISALPTMPAKLVHRAWHNGTIWESPNGKIEELPFLFFYFETAGWRTQYLGLNTNQNITFLSSTWEKNICSGGVIYSLSGNGKSMKVKIQNTSDQPLRIVGVGGSRGVVRPGKTVVVTGNYTSGGFGLQVKGGAYCSSINWNLVP